MPINQITQNYYTVDYNNLWSYINTNIPLFFNFSSSQNTFFSQWITLLQRCDEQNASILQSPASLKFFQERGDSEPEIYQQEYVVGSNVFLLHYRITYMKHLLNQLSDSQATSVSSLEYASKPPQIHWHYPEDFSDIYPLNKKPVIAVEFPFSSANYLIIDGNHRIAKHLEENSSFIPTFFVHKHQVHSLKLLGMSFDLALYLFLNDIYHLTCAKAEYSPKDSQLYSMSLIHWI